MDGHPPGTAPHHPRGMHPPTGHASQEDSAGPPRPRTLPTARGWRTPTARPEDGQQEEGERLTSDAPSNGAGHPQRHPPGLPPVPHGQQGERLTPTQARECPAEPGERRSVPARGANIRAPPATPHRTQSRFISRGRSTPHPLLLSTGTQQWRNSWPHSRHAPGLRRWTRHTRSSGRLDPEAGTTTPPGGRGCGPRPGDDFGAHRGQRARGTHAASGRRARPLPRVETGQLHRRQLVPQATPPTRPR